MIPPYDELERAEREARHAHPHARTVRAGWSPGSSHARIYVEVHDGERAHVWAPEWAR